MIWIALAITIAIVSAVRGMWSPCGLSMLSTFTPMSERGRGHRYWVTATWFILGAMLGGIALGGISAVSALLLNLLLGSQSLLGLTILGGASIIGGLWDFGLLRPALPHHRRQVNETWLRQFRRWFTASAFGAQVGFGLATYIMTTGVYLTVLIGALSGSVTIALLTGLTFGTTRGLLVLCGSPISSPERLMLVHRRIERMRGFVRGATSCVLLSIGIISTMWGSGLHRYELLPVVVAVVGVGALLRMVVTRGATPKAPAHSG